MDAIYLAIDGQSKGPYTQAQVRDMLAKKEITPETLAWYEGLAEWTAAGPLVGANTFAAAHPPAGTPPPISAMPLTPSSFTKDELRHIAKSQNLLMWAVLANIVSLFFAHFLAVFGLPLYFGVAAFEIYALYVLCKALRYSTFGAVLLCFCMFIPCLSLILLVIVSSRASGVLKAAGVRVGLMGGNPDDIKD